MFRSYLLISFLLFAMIGKSYATPVNLPGFHGFDGPATVDISTTNPRDDLILGPVANSSYQMFVDIEVPDAAQHSRSKYGYLIAPTMKVELANTINNIIKQAPSGINSFAFVISFTVNRSTNVQLYKTDLDSLANITYDPTLGGSLPYELAVTGDGCGVLALTTQDRGQHWFLRWFPSHGGTD